MLWYGRNLNQSQCLLKKCFCCRDLLVFNHFSDKLNSQLISLKFQVIIKVNPTKAMKLATTWASPVRRDLWKCLQNNRVCVHSKSTSFFFLYDAFVNLFLWIVGKRIRFGGFCTYVNQIESLYWDHRQRPAQAPNPWWKYIIRTQMNAPLGSKLSAPVDFISLFTLSFEKIISTDKNNRKCMIWHTPIWLQNQHICKIRETNFGFSISWICWKSINFMCVAFETFKVAHKKFN